MSEINSCPGCPMEIGTSTSHAYLSKRFDKLDEIYKNKSKNSADLAGHLAKVSKDNSQEQHTNNTFGDSLRIAAHIGSKAIELKLLENDFKSTADSNQGCNTSSQGVCSKFVRYSEILEILDQQFIVDSR